MSEGGSKTRVFLIVGGAIVALLLAGCCVTGLLVLEWGQETAATAREGVTRADAFAGRPISECHEAAMADVRACGSDISCAAGGQMMFRRCLQVAAVPEDFCASNATPIEQRCRVRCGAEPDPRGCTFACGQVEGIVDQHCRR